MTNVCNVMYVQITLDNDNVLVVFCGDQGKRKKKTNQKKQNILICNMNCQSDL